MVGGARVYDPIHDGELVQCHGVERVGDGLLVPASSPWVPRRSGPRWTRSGARGGIEAGSTCLG
jgi:hypothetical protein